MAQRVYHYMARTVVVTNLPKHMDDETLWSVLEVDRHPTLLEKRVVRDPLAPGRRVAVLIFPDPVRATVLAASLSLQLVGTDCAAFLLSNYITLYAQLESAACVSRVIEPEECQVVVSNIDPNMLEIPKFLETMFSTVGYVQYADIDPLGDSVVEYSCGTEAQTAEFAFDNLVIGETLLSVKRSQVPQFAVPRFTLPADPGNAEQKVVLEQQCLDVLKEMDQSRDAASGPSSLKSQSKKTTQATSIADPTPILHREHALKLPQTISRLVYVEQNYLPPDTVNFNRHVLVQAPSTLEPDGIFPDTPDERGENDDDCEQVLASEISTDTVSDAAEVGLSRDVATLTLSTVGGDEKPVSSPASDEVTVGQITETCPSPSFKQAEDKDDLENIPLVPPHLKEVAESAKPLNVREYFEQLDEWLRDMKGNDFGLNPSDFESFGQYEENARKQIFEAYLASRSKEDTASGNLEENSAAANKETSEILELLASRNYIMKQMSREKDSDSEGSLETEEERTQ